jgi:hypothetical protein
LSECAPTNVASRSIVRRFGAPASAHARSRARACADTQPVEPVGVAGDLIDHAKRGGVGGDRPEQHLLVADRAQVGQAVTAVGEHHRQVADDPARVVAATSLTALCQPA